MNYYDTKGVINLLTQLMLTNGIVLINIQLVGKVYKHTCRIFTN